VAGIEPGSSYNNAIKLGVEILDETSFLKLLSKHQYRFIFTAIFLLPSKGADQVEGLEIQPLYQKGVA